MARVFECVSASGAAVRDYVIQPNREALWCALFDVESLDNLFDMTPAEQAVSVVDAAIARLTADPETFRPLLADDDIVGLRGNRGVLMSLRKHLVTVGGTISGAVESE